MIDARKLLQDFISKHRVEFVAADMPVLESKAKTSEQVTDSYLADLAGRNNLKLATLDCGITHAAVEFINISARAKGPA